MDTSSGFPLLSSIVFLPLLGAAILYLLPMFKEKADPTGLRARTASLTVTLVTFVVSLVMLQRFNSAETGYQLVERSLWIPSFGVSYF